MLADLGDLAGRKREERFYVSRVKAREAHLKNLLENKIPDSFKQAREEIRELWDACDIASDDLKQLIDSFHPEDLQLLTLFSEEEPAMRNELKELTEKRKQWETERKPLIEKQMKEKKEELKKETEKFEVAVLSVIDKWIELHPNDKGSISYPL